MISMSSNVDAKRMVLIFVIISLAAILIDILAKLVRPGDKVFVVSCHQEGGIVDNMRSDANMSVLYVFD